MWAVDLASASAREAWVGFLIPLLGGKPDLWRQFTSFLWFKISAREMREEKYYHFHFVLLTFFNHSSIQNCFVASCDERETVQCDVKPQKKRCLPSRSFHLERGVGTKIECKISPGKTILGCCGGKKKMTSWRRWLLIWALRHDYDFSWVRRWEKMKI